MALTREGSVKPRQGFSGRSTRGRTLRTAEPLWSPFRATGGVGKREEMITLSSAPKTKAKGSGFRRGESEKTGEESFFIIVVNNGNYDGYNKENPARRPQAGPTMLSDVPGEQGLTGNVSNSL